MTAKAVFLDRDRTLIEDPGYISDPAAIRLLPGVDRALSSLSAAGYKLVVVTNQSGIARGLLTEEVLGKIHDELRRQLVARGAKLDGVYYCPFHPEGVVEAFARESDLRKPQPGMLIQAAQDLDIDLAQSWMVGDSARDVEAGQRAGCRTVRVRGKTDDASAGAESQDEVQADFTVSNLVDAARVILHGQVQDQTGTGLFTAAGAKTAPPAEALRHDVTMLEEILQHFRQLNAPPTFSPLRTVGVVLQIFALLTLAFAVPFLLMVIRSAVARNEISAQLPLTALLILTATVLQMAALACFLLSKRK